MTSRSDRSRGSDGSPIAEALAVGGPRSLRESAVAKLRSACITGVLAPGERLSESRLARLMKISRGPLREAIFQLEREGLVIHESNRGAHVMPVSAADVREIFQLRAALESCAAADLARILTKAQADKLQMMAESLGGLALMPDALNARDLGFHEAVCVDAGNARLLRMWRQLRNQT